MSNYAIVYIQNFQKFMCNTSRDIMHYFSVVASEDPVVVKLKIFYLPTMNKLKHIKIISIHKIT